MARPKKILEARKDLKIRVALSLKEKLFSEMITQGYPNLNEYINDILKKKNPPKGRFPTLEELEKLDKIKVAYLKVWLPIANNLNQIAKTLNTNPNNKDIVKELITLLRENNISDSLKT